MRRCRAENAAPSAYTSSQAASWRAEDEEESRVVCCGNENYEHKTIKNYRCFCLLCMSFRILARDIRDSIGRLSRRSFEVSLNGHNRRKSRCAVHELPEQPVVIQTSCWANLPPELLIDVIKRVACKEACHCFCSSLPEILEGDVQ